MCDSKRRVRKPERYVAGSLVQGTRPVRIEAPQRAFFVGAHEPAIIDDIAGKNGR
jgi:hypothetical protein